jgi:hypothetical protein
MPLRLLLLLGERRVGAGSGGRRLLVRVLRLLRAGAAVAVVGVGVGGARSGCGRRRSGSRGCVVRLEGPACGCEQRATAGRLAAPRTHRFMLDASATAQGQRGACAPREAGLAVR